MTIKTKKNLGDKVAYSHDGSSFNGHILKIAAEATQLITGEGDNKKTENVVNILYGVSHGGTLLMITEDSLLEEATA